MAIGVGLDSTSAFTGAANEIGTGTSALTTTFLASTNLLPQLGQHFFQALEAEGGGTTTFNYQTAPTNFAFQTLQASWRG